MRKSPESSGPGPNSMAPKSSIDRLPRELREKLLEMLKNPGITQREITDAINLEAGETVVSKSSVNRYAQRMEEMIERTRQAREVADVYATKIGYDTRNQLGKIINERVRMLAFELSEDMLAFQERGVEPKAIAEIIQKVSRALKELEQAEKLNAERTAQIRKEALEQAAEAAEKALKKEGGTKAALLAVRRDIFGLEEDTDDQ